jgi:hypothetical protein
MFLSDMDNIRRHLPFSGPFSGLGACPRLGGGHGMDASGGGGESFVSGRSGEHPPLHRTASAGGPQSIDAPRPHPLLRGPHPPDQSHESSFRPGPRPLQPPNPLHKTLLKSQSSPIQEGTNPSMNHFRNEFNTMTNNLNAQVLKSSNAAFFMSPSSDVPVSSFSPQLCPADGPMAKNTAVSPTPCVPGAAESISAARIEDLVALLRRYFDAVQSCYAANLSLARAFARIFATSSTTNADAAARFLAFSHDAATRVGAHAKREKETSEQDLVHLLDALTDPAGGRDKQLQLHNKVICQSFCSLLHFHNKLASLGNMASYEKGNINNNDKNDDDDKNDDLRGSMDSPKKEFFVTSAGPLMTEDHLSPLQTYANLPFPPQSKSIEHTQSHARQIYSKPFQMRTDGDALDLVLDILSAGLTSNVTSPSSPSKSLPRFSSLPPNHVPPTHSAPGATAHSSLPRNFQPLAVGSRAPGFPPRPSYCASSRAPSSLSPRDVVVATPPARGGTWPNSETSSWGVLNAPVTGTQHVPFENPSMENEYLNYIASLQQYVSNQNQDNSFGLRVKRLPTQTYSSSSLLLSPSSIWTMRSHDVIDEVTDDAAARTRGNSLDTATTGVQNPI